MSVTKRARSVAGYGIRVQRRIAIAQVLWWPALIVAGAIAGTTAAVVMNRRRAPKVVASVNNNESFSADGTPGMEPGDSVDASVSR